MKKSDEIYNQLMKKYTDEEIVEGYVFNETTSASEQREIDEEFRKLRLARLNSMSDQEKLMADLLQFKYAIKMYLENDRYDEKYSFGNQLKTYIQVTKRNSKEIASDLDIHPTKLSRLINQKENPNIELMYRLEKHSSEEIPAFYWWRLYAKELENSLRTDLQKKIDEGKKVKNPLEIGA